MLDAYRLLALGVGASFHIWITQVWAVWICKRTANELYTALTEGQKLLVRCRHLSHHDVQHNPQLMFHHHFLAALILLKCLAFETCAYYVIFRILFELSSPLVCSRDFLRFLKIRSEKFRLTIGLTSVVLFLLIRILPIPWYYAGIYRILDTEDYNRLPMADALLGLVGGVLLDVINLSWFLTMIHAVWNILRNKKSYT